MEKQKGAALHGLSTLKAGISEPEFLSAFEAFYRHLKDTGYVRSYRMMGASRSKDSALPCRSSTITWR